MSSIRSFNLPGLFAKYLASYWRYIYSNGSMQSWSDVLRHADTQELRWFGTVTNPVTSYGVITNGSR
jgi:hypothetical protein